MSVVQPKETIEYPESDGKPMGETDVHIDWMIRIRDILRYRYRGQRVYVASNLLVYYEEGDPTKFLVPDGFVVKDCEPGRRRTFKIWEEGKTPNVAFEVTSRSSRRDDKVFKPRVYAQIGVTEYFLYDPLAEYLTPPLQGFRLVEDGYQPIEPNATGALESKELEIGLRLDRGNLVLYDGLTGHVLYSEAEAAEAARAAAEAAHAAEKTAREAAEKRAAELETELQRLRDELNRQARDS